MVYVSHFRDGSAEESDLLGGKGAGLAEMTRMGLPVPPGFTITTAACRAFFRSRGIVPAGLEVEVDAALADLEAERGRRLGDPSDPLLLSIRSGAPVSMPGMMDTVLNLGLTTETVKGLIELTGDPRFAYDAYRRFLEMFGSVVLAVPHDDLASARDAILGARRVGAVEELDAEGLHDLTEAYGITIRARAGHSVPEDPRRQLTMAIEAVFRSWNGRRARDYRELEGIADDLGTAVNIQSMVFGNTGSDSGTGVAFTRDPATGDPTAYGDFLVDAQGEDVVAGIRQTQPLSDLGRLFPEAAAQLDGVFETLEGRYRDMCDIEFTIEHGRLFILQTRIGKRTATAAVRIATDLGEDGTISHAEAVARVRPELVERLLHPRFADTSEHEVLTRGLNASPGAAVGAIVVTADAAVAAVERGEDVILVRTDTSPDDLHGLVSARGVLTARGGLVSHAAVVARGIGTPAVCGAADLMVDVAGGRIVVGDRVLPEGTVISLDGATGEVFEGALPLVEPEPSDAFDTLLEWADEVASMEVRANADVAEDAARARSLGARGIGLCRTEHQFLGERVEVIRRVILADDELEERRALAELHEVQVDLFDDLLAAMDGLPVTVRLLDAPMHEFLPDLDALRVANARGELDERDRRLLDAATQLEETNPMMGTRGCRLGILKPHIYEAQVRALAGAVQRRADAGGTPLVEVMVPLISLPGELAALTERIREVLVGILGPERGWSIPIGTMIETPRAALDAASLAEHADFFSFGTNDLTQLTFGFSRDDVEGRILARYVEDGYLPVSPFQQIDVDGVGRLVQLATYAGRATDAELHVGVCGEHGGDPASIAFFERIGLDHISCSPFRVPTARLAAAHATLVT